MPSNLSRSDEEKKSDDNGCEEQIIKNENKVIKREEDFISNTSPKKSTPTGIIIALVAVVAVAAFFAGLYFSNLDSDQLTKSDLDDAISRIESKIGNNLPSPTLPLQPIKISLDDDPIRGNPDAPITIVEFSDYQCPFCARFYAQTLPLLLEEYIDEGKVNLVYRDFPVQRIHPNALSAAAAAECADDQGKYWEYHDTLFEKQNAWAKLDSNSAISTFSQFATEIELEQQQFDNCLESGQYLEEVQADFSDGKNYQVTGTPGFFIGNEDIGFVKIIGAKPYDAFKKVIDAQLNTSEITNGNSFYQILL